jgi:Family of unknown function (DUF5343)
MMRTLQPTMAAEFVYISNPARIAPFLERIRAAGTPQKVTFKVIESLGFKSTNDRPLLTIVKALGLIDGSGVPTSRWSAFRSKPKAAIAAGIREHYAKLFSLYPDAYQKDNEALHNFFSSHTSVSANTLKFIVATFKTLCSVADFGEAIPASSLPATEAVGTPAAVAHSQPLVTSTPGWTVNINVQLTLPENADAKTFDDFFKAMKKNLLDEK